MGYSPGMILRLAKGVTLLVTFVAMPLVAQESSTSLDTENLETAIVRAVNRERQARGKAPLVSNPWLTKEALKHSKSMATGQVSFGHDGFGKRFKAAKQALAVGSLGENVAYEYRHRDDLAAIVMKRWMESTVHRENILGDYNLIGIGIYPDDGGKVYFTQLFALVGARPAVPVSPPRASPFPRKGS